MTYLNVVKELSLSQKFGVKLGLHNICALMEELRNPHRHFRFIHVAGTNGKGSTANYIADILEASGFRTALFTSPHLCSLRERFIVGGKIITKKELVKIYEIVSPAVKKTEKKTACHLTFFEIVTAMAILYFKEKRARFVVLETGLGGRLDATNYFNSEVCVITNISKDHTEHLGTSLSKIACEKAGIIKEGSKVVLGSISGAALKRIKEVCCQKGIKPVVFGRDYCAKIRKCSLNGAVFDYISAKKKRNNIRIKILGKKQVENAALAIASADELFLPSISAIKEIKNSVWPGRFEIIKKGKKTIIIDCAHNPDGIASFSENMRLFSSGRKFNFIVGILKDKDYRKMLRNLPVARIRSMICVPPPVSGRALDPSCLAEEAKKRFKKLPVKEEESFKGAMKFLSGETGDIAIVGSLFLAGEARKYFKLCALDPCLPAGRLDS
ncbi:MAG: bifunctional folylpolyglutamate synthase/dihydrofolate synthase [Candidatus Aureabacteria bacterium]|nr:bifunctional folylpolyglutamate synthase/dihydrofolate synthase [Candidatus Auribacterota bacterium]